MSIAVVVVVAIMVLVTTKQWQCIQESVQNVQNNRRRVLSQGTITLCRAYSAQSHHHKRTRTLTCGTTHQLNAQNIPSITFTLLSINCSLLHQAQDHADSVAVQNSR
jgi:hypothetical protein